MKSARDAPRPRSSAWPICRWILLLCAVTESSDVLHFGNFHLF